MFAGPLILKLVLLTTLLTGFVLPALLLTTLAGFVLATLLTTLVLLATLLLLVPAYRPQRLQRSEREPRRHQRNSAFRRDWRWRLAWHRPTRHHG